MEFHRCPIRNYRHIVGNNKSNVFMCPKKFVLIIILFSNISVELYCIKPIQIKRNRVSKVSIVVISFQRFYSVLQVPFGGHRIISFKDKCSISKKNFVRSKTKTKNQLNCLSFFLASLFPLPTLVIQCIAGPLSSLTSTILTNPFDVCRTRVQVEQERRHVTQILRELWHDERWKIFTKGLTARMSHSCIYSLFIIFGYETVKRVSLKDEYKDSVRW